MERDEDDSPFTTRQFAAVIDGQHTEFFLSGYENRYFFVISQLGKLGTLISAKKTVSVEDNAAYDVSTVLGKRDDPALEALAMQLIQLIGETSPNPLTLSISLKPTSGPHGSVSPEVFRAILKLIIENRIW